MCVGDVGSARVRQRRSRWTNPCVRGLGPRAGCCPCIRLVCPSRAACLSQSGQGFRLVCPSQTACPTVRVSHRPAVVRATAGIRLVYPNMTAPACLQRLRASGRVTIQTWAAPATRWRAEGLIWPSACCVCVLPSLPNVPDPPNKSQSSRPLAVLVPAGSESELQRCAHARTRTRTRARARARTHARTNERTHARTHAHAHRHARTHAVTRDKRSHDRTHAHARARTRAGMQAGTHAHESALPRVSSLTTPCQSEPARARPLATAETRGQPAVRPRSDSEGKKCLESLPIL